MLPLHRAIAISVFEQTHLSEDLNELLDDNLKAFFEENGIIDALYKENIITWQNNVLVLKNTKDKKVSMDTYWTEISKLIDIDGMNVQEFNQKVRGRFQADSSTLVLIGKLLKKNYTYADIAKTLSSHASRSGQYTLHVNKCLDIIKFKQLFDESNVNDNLKIQTGFKR